MPKMKTKKAAAKRYKVKPSGKIKRAQANKEHILTKKSRSRKNRLKKQTYVDASNMSLVTRCLPYG
jgi:large subunit ribosomal protein L35